MIPSNRQLLSGNEAIALAAHHAGVSLGTGYPGTPSTEILENFSALGGNAQWAPNEKVALEVGIGAAFAKARVLTTMKHVGLNVAADPLFTAAYTGVDGALVLAVADDPGMASSQNEQDSRRYAVAAGLPLIEPGDSQECYDFLQAALELSAAHKLPVLFRMTTRVSHSKTVVVPHAAPLELPPPTYRRDIPQRVMIPGYARRAHQTLRAKLADIAAWGETSDLNQVLGDGEVGIVSSGIAAIHAREAAPQAKVLKLGLTHPLPTALLHGFAADCATVHVVEEGDPYLHEGARLAGLEVAPRPEIYRFGELSVERVRRQLSGDGSPEPDPPRGKPPQLCDGCPHRKTFDALKALDCLVAGDIGCYTLGVLPPFEKIDTCVCMGASLGVGLGLRHVLPPEEAKKVVSIIGDSTFVHSGLTGLAEMVYNPPPTGHVVLILDNGTTAMTGKQEHPGTGRRLNHEPTGRLSIEGVAAALGIPRVEVLDPTDRDTDLVAILADALEREELAVFVLRRPCLLAVKQIREYERQNEERCVVHVD